MHVAMLLLTDTGLMNSDNDTVCWLTRAPVNVFAFDCTALKVVFAAKSLVRFTTLACGMVALVMLAPDSTGADENVLTPAHVSVPVLWQVAESTALVAKSLVRFATLACGMVADWMEAPEHTGGELNVLIPLTV